jgi:hypothetical protein
VATIILLKSGIKKCLDAAVERIEFYDNDQDIPRLFREHSANIPRIDAQFPRAFNMTLCIM